MTGIREVMGHPHSDSEARNYTLADTHAQAKVRLLMAQNAQTPNDEEARKELLATIAAGRDLGPEMDQTLADRYIEQQQKAKAQSRTVAPAPQYAPVGQPGQPQQVGPFSGGPGIFLPLGGVVVAGIIIAAVVTQRWELLGLLWIACIMLGPAFAFRRRAYRNGQRYYRRYGRYGRYEDGYGMGGPMQPPIMGGPGMPQQYDLPPFYQPQPQAPYTPAPQPAPAPSAPTQNAPAQPLPPTPPVNPAG